MVFFKAAPLQWTHFCDSNNALIDRLFTDRLHHKIGFYQNMFNEDFSSIFHYSSSQYENIFEVVTNDDELIRTLLGYVETEYSKTPVNEILLEMVKEIAQSLVWFGRVFYFFHDSVDYEKPRIDSLDSAGVARFFGIYLQWIPKRKEKYSNRSEEYSREIRILDASKLMRFDLPKPLKCMLLEQNRTLSIIDKHHGYASNYIAKAMNKTTDQTNYFDFGVWEKIQKRALYRATLGTGWNCRDYNYSKASDFFYCHRMIRFRRNQLLLRDGILKQLSSELSKVGKSHNTEFSVNISCSEALPSIAHLDELEVRLEREDVGFDEISDYCLKR